MPACKFQKCKFRNEVAWVSYFSCCREIFGKFSEKFENCKWALGECFLKKLWEIFYTNFRKTVDRFLENFENETLQVFSHFKQIQTFWNFPTVSESFSLRLGIFRKFWSGNKILLSYWLRCLLRKHKYIRPSYGLLYGQSVSKDFGFIFYHIKIDKPTTYQ